MKALIIFGSLPHHMNLLNPDANNRAFTFDRKSTYHYMQNKVAITTVFCAKN